MTRGQRGRELARAEFAAAVAAVVVCVLLFLAAPAGTSPMFAADVDVAYLLALAGLGVGFAWMTRIYRSNPEPDPHVWRYRDRD